MVAPDEKARARVVALHGAINVAVCVLVYAILATVSVSSHRFLHEEGVLAHTFASIAAEDFWPVAFLLGARPPLSVLYAPFASFGLGVFWAAHVGVAAAAIALWGGVARALGHRCALWVGLVVGASPLLVGAGAAGLSGADAVTGLGLFAWLLVARRRRFAAFFVLGVLPFVRIELATLVVMVVAWELVHRRFDVMLGVLAFPVMYGLAGAAYHGELLWMLHWPPPLPSFLEQTTLVHSWGALLAITPVVGWVCVARWRMLSGVERFGVAFVLVFVAGMVLLARMQSPHGAPLPADLLPILPVVALVVSRVIDEWTEKGPAPHVIETSILVSLLALALVAERASGSAAALAVVAVWAAGVAAARWHRPRAAKAIVLGLLAIGPVVLTEGGQVERRLRAPHLDEIVTQLGPHADVLRDRTLYTNVPLLEILLTRSNALPRTRVHTLVSPDALHELTLMTNPDNGQRAALTRALRVSMSGRPVLPGELDPRAVAPGTVFVLMDEPRLDLLVPPELRARSTVLSRGPAATISVLEDPHDD